MKYLELKKKVVHWRGSFCMWFYWRNHWGFKMAAPYGDVTDSTFKLPTKSPRDSIRNLRTMTWPIYRQKGRQKYSVSEFKKYDRNDHFANHLLPYFSFFFPIPTLPYCKQPGLPKKKKLSLFLAQQVIFLEVLWSQHLCFDLPTNFISFCK